MAASSTRLSLSRRKCLIGVALVAEIVLFSAVTFVIAYVNSLNAIHHASQQLADSMVDTVAVRVTGYISTTEQSLRNLAVTRRDAMLPEDYGPGGPEWSAEWTLALRSNLMAMQYDVYAFAVQLDDASIVSAAVLPGRLLWQELIVDARTVPTHGFRTANVSNRAVATKADAAVEFSAGPRGRGTKQNAGYYALKEIMGVKMPWCVWTLVYLDPVVEKFETCVSCSVVNATGTFIGILAVVRDIDAFGSFLKQVAVTPNTAMFMVDSSLFLTAASTEAPTTVLFPDNASTASLGPGCMNSGLSDGMTVRVGCRASVHDYPYEPLQSLAASDLDLLRSPTRRSAYRQLAGSTGYYIVCLPVLTTWFNRWLHLVLFLPEGDVLSGVQQGLVLAIGMCVALCLIGALLSSFLVATLIGVEGDRRARHAIMATALTMDEMSTVYAAVVDSCRAYDRLRGREAAPMHRPQQPAVLLVITVAPHLSVRASSDSLLSITPAKANLLSKGCIEEHGGRAVERGNDAGDGQVASAGLWHESEADGDVADEPELRAVLCGLALLRLGCASAAVVVRGDVLRYHSDPFRHGTLLQDAEALLSVAAGAGLVASEAVLQRCPSGVLTTEERIAAPGCRAVTGVTTSLGLEPRVHFAHSSASVHVLLQRARSSGSATPGSSSGGDATASVKSSTS